MVESCLVIALTALFFFGFFQIARLYAAREILDHAAAAGARAEAVGFNRFMVHKVVRVASIPNAGRLETEFGDVATPGLAARWERERAGRLWTFALRARPVAPRTAFERSRIPLYLGADHAGELPSILAYDRWDTVGHQSVSVAAAGRVRMRVWQAYPLRRETSVRVGARDLDGGDVFYRAFYAADTLRMESETVMDEHASFYLR